MGVMRPDLAMRNIIPVVDLLALEEEKVDDFCKRCWREAAQLPMGWEQSIRSLSAARLLGGAGLDGIRILSRGNGETYFVHLRTRDNRRPWHYYAASITAGDDWREATLPFDSFRHSAGLSPASPRPQDIVSIGIVAYGRDHRADLSVAAITLY